MKKINSEKAPAALGPYSQAIITGNLVFVSGQLGIDYLTAEFVGDSIEEQTKQALNNIKSILQEENLLMTDVVKATVLLSDIKDFTAMNNIYATFFDVPYPARAAFEVANLPKYAKVEIEVIAEIK